MSHKNSKQTASSFLNMVQSYRTTGKQIKVSHKNLTSAWPCDCNFV